RRKRREDERECVGEEKEDRGGASSFLVIRWVLNETLVRFEKGEGGEERVHLVREEENVRGIRVLG
ncbi:hypothetical protein HAX54_031115, partial [Datura stramonium]|nr:hypothetical protein [Datura stramonium]